MKMAVPTEVINAKQIKSLERQPPVSAHIDDKRVFGTVANPPAFPIVIAEWERNKREIVRVCLDLYNGRHTFSARAWWRDGDELRPGKSGLTLSLKHLPACAEALAEALARARELGLLGR